MATPANKPCSERCVGVWRVAFLIAVIFAYMPAHAQSTQCNDNLTTIFGGTAIDLQLACSGVRRARDFMAKFGLDSGVPATIVVSDVMPKAHGFVVLGKYDARTETITIPSLKVAQGSNSRCACFGATIDQEMYRSFVVHEMAHAIAHQSGLISVDDPVSQEYLAYAVQFATMNPILRKRILRQHNVDGFAADHEITLVYLMLGPDQFAVKSYLHFSRPENGAHFVHRIRSGAFRPGDQR